jgi:hypothetical protein
MYACLGASQPTKALFSWPRSRDDRTGTRRTVGWDVPRGLVRALGDFQPRESDLDLVIVTVGALSDETVAALQDLHQRFDHSASAWAARLDAVYIPQEVVRDSSPTASPAHYPMLHWPALLVLEPLESGWPIWRYTLRVNGVVVSGPDPARCWTPSPPTTYVVRRRPRSRNGERGRTATPRGSRGCRYGVSTRTWC